MEDILILAIDIGNTNIVVGCIRGDEVLFTERLSTNTTHTTLEYAISFKNVLEIYQIDAKEIEGAIISSVVLKYWSGIVSYPFKFKYLANG